MSVKINVKVEYDLESAWETWAATIDVPDEIAKSEEPDEAIAQYVIDHPDEVDLDTLRDSGDSGMSITHVEVYNVVT